MQGAISEKKKGRPSDRTPIQKSYKSGKGNKAAKQIWKILKGCETNYIRRNNSQTWNSKMNAPVPTRTAFEASHRS